MVAELSQHRLEEAIALGVGLIALPWLVQRPGTALVALLIYLPFEPFVFAFLLGAHVPAAILRPATAIEELLGIALLISGLKEIGERRRSMSRVDKWGLAYVAIVTIYLLVPELLTPGSPAQWSIRLQSWRSDAAYVLIFVAARHAPISQNDRRRLVKAVLAVATVAVAVGFYQRVSPHGFSSLITKDQFRYQTTVLGESSTAANATLSYITNLSPLRISSIFLSPFEFANYLLLTVALLCERVARGERRLLQMALLGGSLACVYLTQVRADDLGVGLVLGLAFIPTPRRPVAARLGLLLVVSIGIAIALPSVASNRLSGAEGGAASSKDHVHEFLSGISTLDSHPLGQGLGVNAATAARYGTPGKYTSDNTVLQVGDELGLVALVVWLFFVIGATASTLRRARSPDPVPVAAGLALLGILVAGLYHQAFLTYPVPWTLWALVGVGLNPFESGDGKTSPGAWPSSRPFIHALAGAR